jgi:hypothetical protein
VVRVYADSLAPPDKKDDKKADKKADKESKPTPKADKLLATLKFGYEDPKAAGSVGVERIWGKDSTLVLVPERLRTQVRKDPVLYLDKHIEPFNIGNAEQNVTKVEITRTAEKKTYEVVRAAKSGEPWKFTKPDALKDKKANGQVVTGILSGLNRPSVVSVVAEKPDEKALAGYGLSPPLMKVLVTVTKDKKEEKHEFEIGKEAGSEKEGNKGTYFKLGGKDVVYRVMDNSVAALNQDLRDPVLFTFKPDDVKSLKVIFWNSGDKVQETRNLVKTGEHWSWMENKNYALDDARVNGVIQAMASLRADPFVAQEAKGTSDPKVYMKLVVTLNDNKSYDVTFGTVEGAKSFAISSQHPGAAFMVIEGVIAELRKSFGYLKKG